MIIESGFHGIANVFDCMIRCPERPSTSVSPTKFKVVLEPTEPLVKYSHVAPGGHQLWA